jgi:hypothetical protein
VNENAAKSEKESDNNSNKIEIETIFLASKATENKTIE